MAVTRGSIHEVAEAVLGCVCAALTDAAGADPDQPGCPCRSCVVPGMPAWDSCDDPCGQNSAGGAGGQLTVNVLRVFQSTDFPSADRGLPPAAARGTRMHCAPPANLAVELAVTLLRCAPVPDEDGCPPSCEDLEATARILHTDMATVYNALLCCLPGSTERRRGRAVFVGDSRTIGPQGGCVGLEQRVTVGIPGCLCPSEEGTP
ncbi:hypothetical protein OG234_13150 [Streptomyces sp. NBC_01420]|uniref:hypothetical protein n=1 Tax=Streptomyces sp. NBC_01420 TaxID=2903858 RepID=UPI0032525960